MTLIEFFHIRQIRWSLLEISKKLCDKYNLVCIFKEACSALLFSDFINIIIHYCLSNYNTGIL